MRIDLSPHHSSMRSIRRRPADFSEVRLEPSMVELCEREALAVFSNMTMAGHTFVQAIASVYLTGLNHGSIATITQERDDG